MQLIQSIEISPYGFANEEYDHPNGNSKDLPEEWYQYWKKCISDKSLERLEPIHKGSYLVDIETINDDELEEILQNKFTDMELPILENVFKLDGGIALKENNEFYIVPQCCGDLGNIWDWERIFGAEENTWHQIWIGHPCVNFRKNNGRINFSVYTEPKEKYPTDYEVLVTVSESALQTELVKMRKLHTDFEHRIRETLDKMGIPNSEEISKIMTGNE